MQGEPKTSAAAIGPPRRRAVPRGMARYEILRPIGRGAMGVVYEALDRERQRLVALKTLRHFTPAALYLFKREFRALADVHHPNLVNLYELVIAETDRAFFTMELVRGTDLVSYVRQGPTARLRPALRQLVEGIRALHGAGKLHRDIKPSNVRVTPEGRVVLLDLGVATELAPAIGDAANEPWEAAGTARYMAPELSSGEAPTAASDWYSVGVILDELLAGGAPSELDALRKDLLRRDPAERPGGAEIARRARGHEEHPVRWTPAPVHRPDAGGTFVGREASLHALRNAFEAVQQGASITVRVPGSPGMGTSTLVRRFLDEVGGAAVVLRGRADERESVPYKAVDGVVDALSRHLMSLDGRASLFPLPADAASLARLFPVLLRVPACRDLAAPGFDQPGRARGRAFTAFREILRSLAKRQPLIVYVDDAHWGDADSASLLVELMRPPDPPPILFIAAYRDEEAERSAFLIETGARWPAGAEVRVVPVGPLEPRESRQLALALLGSRDESAADTVARESGGSPFLIEELARYQPARRGDAVKLAALVGSGLAQLSEDARRLLEVVAVGGRPLPVSVVAEASGLQRGMVEAIDSARAYRFVRTGLRDGHEVVEPSHGRIRDIIVAQLSETTVRSHHRRLAEVLSRAHDVDLEATAVHFLGAGDSERGARLAEQAAEQASTKLAFDRAASLLRLALANLPSDSVERPDLNTRLGEALECSGRSWEAARAYLDAAEHTAAAPIRLRLERAAAEQLLASGRIDEGAAVLRRVLVAARTKAPVTPLGAIACLLFYRLLRALVGLGFERRELAASPDDRLRIDAMHSFVTGFSIVDIVVATCMQARHLMLALRRGSSADVMRAATIELTHVASLGGPIGRRERALDGIIDSLAARTDDAEVLAFVRASRGTALIYRGRWRQALEILDGSFTDLAVRRAGWQSNANVFATYAIYCLGDLRALAARQARVLTDAERRGDLYTEVNLRTVTVPALCLADDDPEAARRNVREAMARWSHRGFLVQHWQAMRAEAEIELYVGNARAARERLRRDATKIRRSFILASQFLRISNAYIRGRCAIATAAVDPARCAARLAAARRIARQLGREHASHSPPLAALLAAGIGSVAGDREKAARSLRTAIELARRADMNLQADAARYQLGLLLGGDEGRALVESASSALAAQGVRAPLRFVSMIAPGRFEPPVIAAPPGGCSEGARQGGG
jgi:eukaryotic-like serine/threonine-protein kinase